MFSKRWRRAVDASLMTVCASSAAGPDWGRGMTTRLDNKSGLLNDSSPALTVQPLHNVGNTSYDGKVLAAKSGNASRADLSPDRIKAPQKLARPPIERAEIWKSPVSTATPQQARDLLARAEAERLEPAIEYLKACVADIDKYEVQLNSAKKAPDVKAAKEAKQLLAAAVARAMMSPEEVTAVAAKGKTEKTKAAAAETAAVEQKQQHEEEMAAEEKWLREGKSLHHAGNLSNKSYNATAISAPGLAVDSVVDGANLTRHIETGDANSFKCPDAKESTKKYSDQAFPGICRTKLASKGIEAAVFRFEDVPPARPSHAPPVVWLGRPFCEDIDLKGECVQSDDLDWVWDTLLRGFPGARKQDAIVDENKITLVSSGIYVFSGSLHGIRDLSAALAVCDSNAMLIHLGDVTGSEAQQELTGIGGVPLALLEPETAHTPYASKQFPVVVRQFWSQSLAEQFPDKLLFAPMGYKSGFYGHGWGPYATANAPNSISDFQEAQRVAEVRSRVPKVPEARKYAWSFVGNPNEPGSETMTNAMRNISRGFLVDSNDDQTLQPSDVRRTLENSIFCPAPTRPGWSSQETRRFSEAMAAGCIPIVETGHQKRIQAGEMTFSPKAKSVKSCFHFCESKGFPYFGVQNPHHYPGHEGENQWVQYVECTCFQNISDHMSKPSKGCVKKDCVGCLAGGFWADSVYNISREEFLNPNLHNDCPPPVGCFQAPSRLLHTNTMDELPRYRSSNPNHEYWERYLAFTIKSLKMPLNLENDWQQVILRVDDWKSAPGLVTGLLSNPARLAERQQKLISFWSQWQSSLSHRLKCLFCSSVSGGPCKDWPAAEASKMALLKSYKDKTLSYLSDVIPSDPTYPMLYSGWEHYRIGDMVFMGTAMRGEKEGGENYVLQKFPNSIAADYMRLYPAYSRDDVLSWGPKAKHLLKVIQERVSQNDLPPPDALVLPLRVGDVLDLYTKEHVGEMQEGREIKANMVMLDTVAALLKNGPFNNGYLQKLSKFTNIGRVLRRDFKWVRQIILVAGSHRELASYKNSFEYIRGIKEGLEQMGFVVSLRLGHNPDADLTFMIKSKILAWLVDGNWANLVRCVAQAAGSIVIGGEGIKPPPCN